MYLIQVMQQAEDYTAGTGSLNDTERHPGVDSSQVGVLCSTVSDIKLA